MEYVFSESLRTFLGLAENRMSMGLGSTLLLEGPPGGGKTAFAKALAAHLNGSFHYYSGTPDRERDLLYEVDVEGVLRREAAWVSGPAWEAFERSKNGGFSVLLIDEVDKTNAGFDAFLLRLLEDFSFRAPNGKSIEADPAKLAVVLTSNGRRKLRPEVLRRCQRVEVPLPSGEILKRILRQIIAESGEESVSSGLLDLVVRIGDAVREDSTEFGPSPKEMANFVVDLKHLARTGADERAVRLAAASWLTKSPSRAAHIDTVVRFRWVRALRAEAGGRHHLL